MKDILLINPPNYLSNEAPEVIPLGIAYLAAFLEREGHTVAAYDCHYKSLSEVGEILRKVKSRIIGITCLSETRMIVLRIAKLIRQLNKDAAIVLGGMHATIMYEQVLDNFPVDFVVLGEGEKVFSNLVNNIDNPGAWPTIKGLAYKQNGRIFRTSDKVYVEDLDTLPFPARHHFLGERYTGPSWLKQLEGQFKKPAADIKSTSIIASRGCQYNCIFCCNSQALGRKWRFRSPENVVDEISWLKREFDCECIAFQDNNLLTDPQWTMEICRKLIDQRLDIVWGCQARVDRASMDVLTMMKEAGCVLIAYGVESFSRKILETVHKKITVHKIIKAIRMTYDTGILASVNLMVGNPGENEDTVSETRKWLDMLISRKYITSADIEITKILPGTGLYELAKKHNIIDDSFWLSDGLPPYYTAEHTVSRLKDWYNELLQIEIATGDVHDTERISYY